MMLSPYLERSTAITAAKVVSAYEHARDDVPFYVAELENGIAAVEAVADEEVSRGLRTN